MLQSSQQASEIASHNYFANLQSSKLIFQSNLKQFRQPKTAQPPQISHQLGKLAKPSVALLAFYLKPKSIAQKPQNSQLQQQNDIKMATDEKILINISDLLHKFKMRGTEIMVKKIDLRERVNLHSNKSLRPAQTSFPLHKKLRHPSFQIMRSHSPPKVYAGNIYTDADERDTYGYNRAVGSAQAFRNKFSRQEDKTYNNNYKLFPKRSFLRSSYVVENSNIVIDIFSKKVQFQERKNDFLAKSLSLQLRNSCEKIFANERTAQIKPSTERQRLSRQSHRAQSAREIAKPRYDKVERFTPWEVETLELLEHA